MTADILFFNRYKMHLKIILIAINFFSVGFSGDAKDSGMLKRGGNKF